MRRHHIIRIAAALALAGAAAVPSMAMGQRSLALASSTVPPYQHIFVIMEENHSYDQIIDNPTTAIAAQNLNTYATQYGLATNYFALINHSMPNYVALLGGSFYCIEDNAFYTDSITATFPTVNPKCEVGKSYPATIPAPAHPGKPDNLASQLDAAHLSWKAYQQSLPSPGFLGEYYPSKNDTLYVSKHDPFLNFASLQNSTDLPNIVPDTYLSKDLQSGQVPNFGFITPDECHDMHGGMKECPGSSKPLDSNDLKLISAGDAYAASTVSEIMKAPFWSQGNNAIVITFDEYDDADPTPPPPTSCCDAPIPGTINGGRIATIVITSQGPRGVQDPTEYNHYSLLQTIQDAFGLGCLQFTCDTKNVTPMAPLFATS